MCNSQIHVLAGPTAVGKGTVVQMLRSLYPELVVSISVTTRPPRPNEQDGVDYFFVSEDRFDKMIENNELLEYATVHGKYRYGTPGPWVIKQVDAGKHVLLEIDLDGARQVRSNLPSAQFIFLSPPSWEELERRLRERATENLDEQQRRLKTAKTELAAAEEFDANVINDNLEVTVKELATLMGLD